VSNRTCSVEDCERPYRCSGFCGLHYDRMRRWGTTEAPAPTERVCQVPDCGRKHNCQGYCRAHYKRYLQFGDPQAWKPLRDLPVADERADIVSRILRKCHRTERGCVQWDGLTLPSGYGTISWGSRTWVVHRAMWTAVVGPIPCDDDWTLDHLCSNRRCVNVGHLEVVTRTENSLRGGGLHRAQQLNAQRLAERVECVNGHRITEANTYFATDGRRVCRQCSRDSWRRGSEKMAAKRRAQYRTRRESGATPKEAVLASWSPRE
jgi:hypothetical protein